MADSMPNIEDKGGDISFIDRASGADDDYGEWTFYYFVLDEYTLSWYSALDYSEDGSKRFPRDLVGSIPLGSIVYIDRRITATMSRSFSVYFISNGDDNRKVMTLAAENADDRLVWIKHFGDFVVEQNEEENTTAKSTSPEDVNVLLPQTASTARRSPRRKEKKNRAKENEVNFDNILASSLDAMTLRSVEGHTPMPVKVVTFTPDEHDEQ